MTCTQSARALLTDISIFSRLIVRRPLRDYQVEPLRAVLESVLGGWGLEFMMVFPRQSGKNEAVAQLVVYLMNLMQRVGGNVVMGAQGDTLGMALARLEECLDNGANRGMWRKGTRPCRRTLGKAECLFLSTSRSSPTRGQTAHWLLVIDEAQDQDPAHVESVFTPMRAAHNATALYTGTVKLTTDFLWRKKLELEADEARDGIRRVFTVAPERVIAANPAYRTFLENQVERHGRRHPIVAAEYYLEPMDGSGGLFDARRRALMQGTHPRQTAPQAGRLYAATVDLAGEDEGATQALARLANPARDYTAATVFEVVQPPPGCPRLPAYHAVDCFVDHGSRHFQDLPGRPALVQRLLAWLEGWGVAHVVADESGVGLGVVSWLRAALGEGRVTGLNFSGRAAKAAVGTAFLALVETGRFRYWDAGAAAPGQGPREGDPLSDGWWFWRQVEACSYRVPPEGRIETDLRWGVAAHHRTMTPAGPQPTHDDRLFSAALVAELDRLVRSGRLSLGLAASAVVTARDPLGGEVY